MTFSQAAAPAGDLSGSFRQRATFMKTWKPASTPSNRDRLELYALHKQAVSGDAPPLVLSSPTPGERAKYNAWKQKSGMAPSQAMRLYLEESDRQVRVYGTTTASTNEDQRNQQTLTPENTPLLQQQDGSSNNNNNNITMQQQRQQQQQQQPRGLAAIPLLCAAASESRQAYLRRLANTRLEQAWWNRQEPLCAAPGSFWALPEQIVLSVASGLEYISLVVVVASNNHDNHTSPTTSSSSSSPLFSLLPPPPVLQSFFWPAHNALLAVWMGVILVATTWTAAVQLLSTLVWGSRRTGHSLFALWNDTVLLASQSIHALTERHQPLTARLTGLLLLPFTVLVALTNSIGGMSSSTTSSSSSSPSAIGTSLLYCLGMGMTWWYWFLTLPWLAFCFLSCAVLAGGCFALIELAGV